MFRLLLYSILFIQFSYEDNPSFPKFNRQAEFIVETLVIDSLVQRKSFQCIYGYDQNRLILHSDEQSEFYNYTILKKAIYGKNPWKRCDVYPIDIDNEFDGFSAITNPNDNSTHIRSLQDFFLLTADATYKGSTSLRGGIPVDQWISFLSNDTEIIWSFANASYIMPWSTSDYSIPIQRVIRHQDTGLILHLMNIFQYKPFLATTDLTPPKGIFCDDLVEPDDLLSLQDFGITFTDQFNVRIDASSTARSLWQSVHLHYNVTNGRKLVRYDYTPSENTRNSKTIILDYTDDSSRAYTIDRQTGSCLINESAEIISATSILHNPIETLIKYEGFLLANPPHRIFQYVGTRPCRGSLECAIFIGQLPVFPPDADQNWAVSTLEWAWAKRNPDDPRSSFDYPVYLNLNLYPETANIPPSNVHYEFYDYRREAFNSEFDVNLCYRSNQLWYQHLAFELQSINTLSLNDLENLAIDRRRLTEHIQQQITTLANVTALRVSQIELDHHPRDFGHEETLYCIFTLLDRTPFGNPTVEIEILDARNNLEQAINGNLFQIQTEDGVALQAVPGSLENLQYFYAFNANRPTVNLTVYINRTQTEVIQQVYEKIEYSDGAQAGAVVGGTIVGILAGALMVFLAIQLMRRKARSSPTGGLTFRNISFRIGANRKQDDQATITMEDPSNNRSETSS